MLGLLLFALLWAAAALPAAAQDLLPVPALSARVIDQAGALQPAQRDQLEAKLAAFEHDRGTQIVVLLVPTTRPEDIAAYANRVADSWKIGRREVGDGLLIVVARDDRRIRIEVARALEGAVPDLAARRIIDDRIAPAFKVGDYAGGLAAGIDALIARIQNEGLPQPDAAAGTADDGDTRWDGLPMFFFVAVFVFGSILTRLLGRKLAMAATGGGAGVAAWLLGAGIGLVIVAVLLAMIMVGAVGSRRMVRRGGLPPPGGWGGGGFGGGGGFSGGGFGGGGFGSGGGGSFGGGGASGDW